MQCALQVTSSFRREADDICPLLGFYAVTLRDKEGTDRFPETSVWNYHYKLHNNSEQRVWSTSWRKPEIAQGKFAASVMGI
jgi:hypothetical protein